MEASGAIHRRSRFYYLRYRYRSDGVYVSFISDENMSPYRTRRIDRILNHIYKYIDGKEWKEVLYGMYKIDVEPLESRRYHLIISIEYTK